jgi:hypothetical protein
MSPLEECEIKIKHCYLLYHIVFKESSVTTKRSLVNNASFKTNMDIS